MLNAQSVFLFNADIQGGSNMTGTNCDLFTHNQSQSYLNHLVHRVIVLKSLCVPYRALIRILFIYVIPKNALIQVYITFIVSNLSLHFSVIY
jgi:hypothetical protein